MSDVNVIRDDINKRRLYDFEDTGAAFECTNRRGRVVSVTPIHFERFQARDGLEKIDPGDERVELVTEKGITILSTNRWIRNNGQRVKALGYMLKKPTAGTERSKKEKADK